MGADLFSDFACRGILRLHRRGGELQGDRLGPFLPCACDISHRPELRRVPGYAGVLTGPRHARCGLAPTANSEAVLFFAVGGSVIFGFRESVTGAGKLPAHATPDRCSVPCYEPRRDSK